jgi:osmotically-inducible protein OsmY
MVHVAGAKDIDIQRDVLEEFNWSPEIEPTEIGVEVERGIVTLTGTVTSYAKKLAAEKSAQRVYGVRAVANDLIVRPADSHTLDDTDIARAVANTFEWSALVPEERIQISVSDGVVTLHGGVDFNFQRTEAERQVLQLAGVRGFHNNISITPPVAADARQIEAEILKALRRSADLDEDTIDVVVKGHTVVLDGTVRSEAGRDEAERLAWGPGVFKVENRIEVQPVRLA